METSKPTVEMVTKSGRVIKEVSTLTDTHLIQYSNPTQTIRDFQGIKRGATFSNESLDGILTDILYPYIPPTIKFINGGSKDIQDQITENRMVYVEKGTKVDQFTIYATIEVGSESSVSCLFKRFECDGEVESVQTTVVVQPGSTYRASFNVKEISDDTHIQIVVSDGTQMAESAIISYKFIDAVYVGYCGSGLFNARGEIDRSKANAYFNTLIKNKSKYIEKRVCKISNQQNITLDDAQFSNIALYPVILFPNSWIKLMSITDCNADDITAGYLTNNDLMIKSTSSSTPVPYTCYISKHPYNVQMPIMKEISYNFIGVPASLDHDGNGVPTLTGFDVLASVPIDRRTVVKEFSELPAVANPYDGLVVYVQETQSFFKYVNKKWDPTNQQVYIVKEAPSTSLGVYNDIAIDIISAQIYQKDREDWKNIGKLPTSQSGSDTPSEPGKAATIEITDVITGKPGTVATVENVGTATNAKLVFTIPRGAQGEQGPVGPAGAPGKDGKDGKDGKAATVKVGKIKKGDTFNVENVGTDTDAIFDFTYPEAALTSKGSVSTGEGNAIHLVLQTVSKVGE